MTTPNITQQPPPIFDGSNYGVWVVRMKAYLEGYNLWNAVEQDVEPQIPRENAPAAQGKQYEEEIAKKCKALSFIQSAVPKDIFSRIMECETTKAVWTKLHEEFVETSRTRHMQAQNLRRHFDLMRMKENQLVKEYIDQLLKLVNQIKMFGEELKEARVAKKILNSAPRKFEATIVSLLQSKDLPDISITEIVNALQAAELRISTRDETFVEKALLAKN
ncbi:PREDICTED: uncharacterized protein LOC18592991 [Theobroma cacao]|uniref:Uncharacterized protein LOC18592991 n=1 Tax=Theobroma cacao TaxID=3641 RepID=A0AB32WNN9_THECC|nr:PREDICTED: uncharacterized protein LOC18592991 [Theobroma cacao]